MDVYKYHWKYSEPALVQICGLTRDLYSLITQKIKQRNSWSNFNTLPTVGMLEAQ